MCKKKTNSKTQCLASDNGSGGSQIVLGRFTSVVDSNERDEMSMVKLEGESTQTRAFREYC